MRARSTLLGVLLILAAAAPAAAQAWDNPSFFAPRAHDDIGVYVINPDDGDLGFAAIWRQSGNINLGVRGGMAGDSDFRVWQLGAELYGPLRLPLGGTPVLLAWNTGIGASFGDGFTALRVPLGASIGFELGGTGSGITIVPYAHPRAVFELFAQELPNDEEETNTEFDLDLDLGADVQVGERWIVRAGVSLPESTTFGLGIAYRIPRPISVR
jgi:hypothetical protein